MVLLSVIVNDSVQREMVSLLGYNRHLVAYHQGETLVIIFIRDGLGLRAAAHVGLGVEPISPPWRRPNMT
jgi:hypothetical protein